jgi:hypothetical protein
MSGKDMEIREMITSMADTPVDRIAGVFSEYRIGGLPLANHIKSDGWHRDRESSFLKGKGMPFSSFRKMRLFRCWVDSIRLLAQRRIKYVPRFHEDVLAKGKA